MVNIFKLQSCYFSRFQSYWLFFPTNLVSLWFNRFKPGSIDLVLEGLIGPQILCDWWTDAAQRCVDGSTVAKQTASSVDVEPFLLLLLLILIWFPLPPSFIYSADSFLLTLLLLLRLPGTYYCHCVCFVFIRHENGVMQSQSTLHLRKRCLFQHQQ